MEPPYLIIWFKNGDLNASALAKLPYAFVHENQTFHSVSEYFGDLDYLRDEAERLVGFGYTFPVEEKEISLYEDFLLQSKLLENEDGILKILLSSGPYRIDCAQAMGSTLYRSAGGKMILAIPNSGFGTLAFNLKTDDMPWPEYFDGE
jgi:hypothetical protein